MVLKIQEYYAYRNCHLITILTVIKAHLTYKHLFLALVRLWFLFMNNTQLLVIKSTY